MGFLELAKGVQIVEVGLCNVTKCDALIYPVFYYVHEPLEVGTERVPRRAFQPTTPSCQGWGTSVVLHFHKD